MSISHSLSNALSGLTVASRAAEVVANNVANATNENYGRREVELASQVLGGRGAGVKFVGVNRIVDQALLSDRRTADASLGGASVRSDFHAALERLTGTPDQGDSLSARMAALESSLLEAASRPDSMPRLQSLADAATGVAGQVNRISDGIQDMRMDAERQIASQVETLNRSVAQVKELNERILAGKQGNRDISGLMDQQQQAIDQIASIVPLRLMPRDNGTVALYTTQGARLLDGQAAKIGFEPKSVIMPEHTLENGLLNGLTIDGRAVRTGENGALSGGSLGALFELRDGLAVDAQERIDALAQDLVGRFTTADDPLPPGEIQLFGDTLVPSEERGIAGRLTVNPNVLPSEGGQLWRLRDGMEATAQGDVGDASRLQEMLDRLALRTSPANGGFMQNQTASGLTGDFLSGIGVARQSAESSTAFATSQNQTLRSMQMADGVDTDQEMQKLMQIEQAYAANARVISVVDEMMRMLMDL
ncbi:flagellar hook-associated protein FlgK [Roseitranquillus sediminis]|uniref:flagellar hook-associated protein FlgK n=1 Tax=Roseitranquillus sediminis TaxID=2809051 RepID=UPI001D0C9BCC|nr:flagellar hook-associated protein FlgK [Roseitranquillus sediminis]MBM9596102.1 flagellar hook-associated protein FlgK [Roseitranquillus sediminis]